MSNFFKKLKFQSVLIIAAVVLLAGLTACGDVKMGLGDSIDFEPPVLRKPIQSKEGPVPTPYYVNEGAMLSGVVYDNIAVTEVILQDANKPAGDPEKILGTAAITNARRITVNGSPYMEYDWVITLDFDESRNGDTIFAEVVAYDRNKNSNENSMAPVTLYIDVRPPLTEDVWIQRTSVRTAYLESLVFIPKNPDDPDSKDQPGLKSMELMDPHGTVSGNVNRYQNGFFHIHATLAEDETRIKDLLLNIYDPEIDLNTPLKQFKHTETSSEFAPRWLISEEELLNAGESLKPGYKENYYKHSCNCDSYLNADEKQGKTLPHVTADNCGYWLTPRYYYRVATQAKDLGDNPGEMLIIEDEGYFVMWEKADEPKGVLDPVIGTVLTKGSQLPVEFFDDDRLGWAFTALLTKDQWDGIAKINDSPTLYIKDHNPGGSGTPTTATNQEKLEWLYSKLVGADNKPVGTDIMYNWRLDKRGDKVEENGASSSVKNQINAAMDEKTVMLQTGNSDSDYGEFVLFTLTSDEKIDPHTNIGPKDTNKSRWAGRSWKIDIIDENAPLIVFDIQKGSPEENTFPNLTNNQFFTIKGYTLRENGSTTSLGTNGVVNFRMAWIPSRMGNPDTYIQRVENALKGIGSDGKTIVGYPASFTGNSELAGIQHWDFSFNNGTNSDGTYKFENLATPSDDSNITSTGGNWINAGSAFRRQNFQRTFSVLGNSASQDAVYGPVGDTYGWKDFHSNDGTGYTLENDTKLFVFYAECNMGHQVFRNMRYLGNKTPPEINIFNITGKIDGAPGGGIGGEGSNTNDGANSVPDVSKPPYGGTATTAYDNALKTYNRISVVTTALRNAGGNVVDSKSKDDIMQPFQAFPRGSILKFFVNAEMTTGIGIKDIQIDDITFDNNTKEDVGGGYYPGTNESFKQSNTYIEYFPDEAQRVLKFTAEDMLGNKAVVQRTIAVTNTALLESITTTTQDGSTLGYVDVNGTNALITIKANFTGQISLKDENNPNNTTFNSNRPELNIRFPLVDAATGAHVRYEYRSIQCEPVADNALSLEFKVKIEQTVGGLVPKGKIETMYFSPSMGVTGPEGTILTTNHQDRPIRLRGSIIINDKTRNQPAFVPGYELGTSNMPNWITQTGSLQGGAGGVTGKNINLDFTRPVINVVSVGGKTRYSGNSNNEYYFRLGETIEVTLSASTTSGDANSKAINNGKLIRPSETGTDLRLQYSIRDSGGTTRGPYNSAFTYQRPAGSDGLVFALTVDGTMDNITANNEAGGVVTGGTNTPYDGTMINLSVVAGTGIKTIVDQYGNPVTADSVQNVMNLAPVNTNIFIKRSRPPLPDARLNNLRFENLTTDAQKNFNTAPTLLVNATSTTGTSGQWEDVRKYSTNGGNTWNTYSSSFNTFAEGTYNIYTRYEDRAGNVGNARTITINVNQTFPRLLGITAVQPSGTYNAGKTLEFNLDFAAPVRIRTGDTTANVSLTLSDITTTTNNADGTNPSYQISLSGAAVTAAAIGSTTGSSTVKFTWSGISGKDMLNGLRVLQLNLSGLEDLYTNRGPGGTNTAMPITIAPATANGTANGTVTYPGPQNPPGSGTRPLYPTTPFNMSGIIVSSISPKVTATSPIDAEAETGNITAAVSSDNRTITLTFSKPIQKGNGTISIRPRGTGATAATQGTYAIPAVMENEGYYVGIDSSGQIISDTQGFECRSSSISGTFSPALPSGVTNPLRTYVAGMADVFNNSSLTTTNRQNLVGTPPAGTVALSNTGISLQTGLSTGPYRKMTHGLIRGMGYTGSYNNDTTGVNAPGPQNEVGAATGSNFMVPDLQTKWVLHYAYQNLFGTTTPTGQSVSMANIRAAFNAAKWRWQEFSVSESYVVVGTSADNNKVTITLPDGKLLLPGYQWSLHFNDGTFTDMAGNVAAGLGVAGRDFYWFWSGGAQRPVVRVDRKSYDARTGADLTGHWAKNGNTANNGTDANLYQATGYNGAIADFNNIYYVITTETPNSRIYYNVLNGRDFLLTGTAHAERRLGSVTGNFGTTSGNAQTGQTAVTTQTMTNITTQANITWEGNNENDNRTTGLWVRPNLIFRNSQNGQYDVTFATGNVRQAVGGDSNNDPTAAAGRYYGFRSYNKDATFTELNTPARSLGGDDAQNIVAFFTYDSSGYEASKNYVIAETRVNHNNAGWTSQTGINISKKGFEGVYRTVVMMNQRAWAPTANQPLIMFGATAPNAIPTLAAFPVKDGVGTVDARFGKVYYRGTNNNNMVRQHYWVSTELVCSWVIQNYGNGNRGSYTRTGDVNDWISAGYGDLTYSLNINAHGQ